MQEEDQERLLAITAAAFKGVTYPFLLETRYGSPGYGTSTVVGWIEEYLQKGLEHCLVAVDETDLVQGFAATTIKPLASTGELSYLAVDASARGMGVGRKLMDATINHFKGLGLRVAMLGYDEHNQRAARFYARCNFTPLLNLSLFVGLLKGYRPDRHELLPLEVRAVSTSEIPLAGLRHFISPYLQTTVEAGIRRKHGVEVDLARVFEETLGEEMKSKSFAFAAWEKGRLAGFCSCARKRAGPIAEIRRPVAASKEAADALLDVALQRLSADGQIAAYCWFNEEDRLSRRCLLDAGFEHIHSAVLVSLPLDR